MPTPRKATPKKFYRSLYFRVIVGILLGIALGVVAPSTAGKMEPLGLGFIKLIRMMIGPIIFFTVVVGIASIGDMRKLGRVGIKALLYFEVVTTIALLIGLLVVNIIQPGAGMNVDASKLDASAIQAYAAQGKHLGTVDFLMNIIPKTFIGAFARRRHPASSVARHPGGVGAGRATSGQVAGGRAATNWRTSMFGVIGLIMQAAPIGAFGAMAFTVGHYGLKTLIPLAKLHGVRLYHQHLVRIHRAGADRACARLQRLEVHQVHQGRAADRAGHVVVGIGAAAHHGEDGGAGLRQIGGGSGDPVGLFV